MSILFLKGFYRIYFDIFLQKLPSIVGFPVPHSHPPFYAFVSEQNQDTKLLRYLMIYPFTDSIIVLNEEMRRISDVITLKLEIKDFQKNGFYTFFLPWLLFKNFQIYIQL